MPRTETYRYRRSRLILPIPCIPHRPDELGRVLRQVAASLSGFARTDPPDFAAVHDTFLVVRDRQFAENRATLCENDLDARFAECALS
jgi:hypothetical protein